MNLFAVVFSRDRALQLDAALRSFWLHCQDADRLPVTVLYLTSHPRHEEQYRQLIGAYERFPNLHFLRQTDFRRNLLQLFFPQPGTRLAQAKQALLLGSGHRLGAIAARWTAPTFEQLVFFLVDDNLFVADFQVEEIVGAIQAHPEAIGFSLRLGGNTTDCYMRSQPQRLPAFSRLAGRIQEYDWTNSELDFGYPLEVSSSVLRAGDLLPHLVRLPFHNPNTLESRLAALAPGFKAIRPKLLCYERSVAFCNPINKTATGCRNRSGNIAAYSLDNLAAEFAAGRRIRVEAYSGLVPTACHQEVGLVLDLQGRPPYE